MYHYQKNIGDYRSATMHLSLLEHGVYNQLLDWYYLDEKPIPADNRTIFRRLSAKSEVEQQAIIDVLSEMFVLTDEGWTHKRVDREITLYKAKAQQAREAGKLGGRPSKKGVGSDGNRDGFAKEPDAKPTDNRKPLTINHKPLTNTTEKDFAPSGLDVRFETFWKAYPKRVGKDAARKAFDKRKPDEAMLNSMLSAIQSQSLTLDWQKDGGQFIPHPATWLNQGRWQDELVSGEPTTNPLLLGAI